MEKASWTYFIILGLSIAYPLAQSFEKRIYMHLKFKYLLPGIGITGAVYLAWDVWFTRAGIWGFNPNFTQDVHVLGLPVEEWLFFLIIPYSCLFLYEVLRYFVRRFYVPKASKITIYILGVLLLSALPFVYDRIYTFVAFSFTALMLGLQLLQKTYKTWFSGFLLTYLFSLLPFLLVNGILTSLPVVWYNNAENLGIRIYTIPLEDFVYLLGLLLPTLNIYQVLLQRYASPKLREKMNLEGSSGF